MRYNFRPASRGPFLSDEQGSRQGRVVKAALAILGNPEAQAFLNAHHPGLGGRPLDLAVASESGLGAVQTALCIEARRGADSC